MEELLFEGVHCMTCPSACFFRILPVTLWWLPRQSETPWMLISLSSPKSNPQFWNIKICIKLWKWMPSNYTPNFTIPWLYQMVTKPQQKISIEKLQNILLNVGCGESPPVLFEVIFIIADCNYISKCAYLKYTGIHKSQYMYILEFSQVYLHVFTSGYLSSWQCPWTFWILGVWSIIAKTCKKAPKAIKSSIHVKWPNISLMNFGPNDPFSHRNIRGIYILLQYLLGKRRVTGHIQI